MGCQIYLGINGDCTNAHIYAIDTDTSGGLYYVGNSNQGSSLSGPFIGKLDTNGYKKWFKEYNIIGKPSAIVIYDNHIYVAGETNSTADKNISISKFDINGTNIWVKQYGTSKDDGATALTIDNDNIYITGRTYGALDGNTNIGGSDIFVSKFNIDGTKLWTKQYGTLDYDIAKAIKTDNNGDVYVIGTVNGSLDNNVYNGRGDAFIKKCNDTGVAVWTKQFGTSDEDEAKALSVYEDNIYVVGYLGNTFEQGDSFIKRFNIDGEQIWAKEYGNTDTRERAFTVTNDSTGSAYIGGGIFIDVPPPVTVLEQYDYYLMKFSEE